MKRQTLEAFKREELKKGASGRLRRSGRIPAVIYGSKAPVTIAVQQNEFEKKFHSVSENTIITIELGKEKHDVLVKDYQEDTLKGKITHIDFYEIEQGKVLRTNVPIRIEGVPAGVKEGGLLEERLYEIEVECLPKDIPEYFELNVEGLNIGDTVHVSDIEIPEGVKALSSDDLAVVTIVTQKQEILPEEAAGEEEGAELEEGAEEAGEEESEE